MMFKSLIATLVCLTFIFSNIQYVQAQDFNIDQLPVPGTMVGESAPFAPLALKGLVINPRKPLEFQFIVDTGSARIIARIEATKQSFKEEANTLIKYFLAGLTIPEADLWVNLSPYEKNRMLPEALGQTNLGRDLLAQDYVLKQLTASLIYPEKNLGKEFWSRVYKKAQQQFGTTNVPVNTFNKVWILPNQAQVFENGNAAYVTKSTLKVMLDEDYLALRATASVRFEDQKQLPLTPSLTKEGGSSGFSPIVRQIILPEIEKEVNTGKNFAPLRQIYQALILAKWYKETIQNSLLDAIYTNKNKVAGVNLDDPSVKELIYQRYLQAYKKGVFNFIKEDPTPDGQVVPRKYFSGGAKMRIPYLSRTHDGTTLSRKGWITGALLLLTVALGVTNQVSLSRLGPYESTGLSFLLKPLDLKMSADAAMGTVEMSRRVVGGTLVAVGIFGMFMGGSISSLSLLFDFGIGKLEFLPPVSFTLFAIGAPILGAKWLNPSSGYSDEKKDPAMNGGIDLNQIKLNRTGKTINVQFDPAQLSALEQGGFEGFTPLITNITPISSPFQLLGINTAKEPEAWAKF